MPMASKLLHCASWLDAVLAAVITVYWIGIVHDGNYCWAAFAFCMMASMFCGGTLLLGVIPSSVLWVKSKQRRDWISLLLTGCSFVIVLVEAIWLNVIPQRGE